MMHTLQEEEEEEEEKRENTKLHGNILCVRECTEYKLSVLGKVYQATHADFKPEMC